MRRSFKSYIATTLDYQESQQIEPACLDVLVTRLRSGDKTVIEEIIKGHLRLVMGIVSDKLRGSKYSEDIVSSALLALTKSVNAASTQLYDNNITAYITSNVKFAIKQAYAENHTIIVPSRTVRYKIAQGKEFKTLVPGIPGEIRADAPDAGNPSIISNHALPYVIPIAKTIEPCIEIREALNKSIESNLERSIINLREEGYSYEEIGKIVGYSHQRIGQIMPKIEARFNSIYGK